MNGLVTIILI